MTTMSPIRALTHRARTVLLLTALVAPFSAHAAAQSRPTPPARKAPAAAGPRTNAAAAAQSEFQSRLQKYLKLRQDLAGRLKPLAPTASAADLAARQESLAAALRDVRKDAKRGDVIPAAVAAQITRIVANDFRHRNATATRAVFEEVPEGVRPAVNKTLPDSAALATVPALLLNELPRLPDNLQYRFIGRDVVLLDGDTRLIIDYISDVLPAH